MRTLLPGVASRLLIPTAFALLLAMNTHAAADRILFDFQTATNAAAWQVVNDDVMGGESTSGFRLTNGAALFQGEVSLENNGGFASVRSLPARHDLAGCEAFAIRVRGDGRGYKFTARTDRSFDSAIYQAVFPTKKGEWRSTACRSSSSCRRAGAACYPANRRWTPPKSPPSGSLFQTSRMAHFNWRWRGSGGRWQRANDRQAVQHRRASSRWKRTRL
jgi:hypothetical protein